MASQALLAQIRFNSPYTRFGPGYIVEKGLDPRSMGMGNLHYGVRIADQVNPANPASYTAFDSMTFIFDAGFVGMLSNLKTDELTQEGSYITLSHLLFGFPVTHWWKASLGVMPFSYVGYDIYDIQEIPSVGTGQYTFQGEGGMNQLYWGNAFLIKNRLSIGFNLKYIFGSVSRSRGVSFPDSADMKNTYVEASMTPSDLYGELGIQYTTELPKGLSLTVGGIFGPQVDINAKANRLVTTYFGDINSVQFFRDTVEHIRLLRGSFTMPVRTGAGVSIGKKGRWLAGVDFSWQNWEKYEYFGESDSLANSWRIIAGGEYTPNPSSILSYFQRVHYRMGFHYGKSNLIFRDNHLNEFGIAFGLGLPIRKSRSTINASVQFGRFGTTADGLIQDNFLRFTVGVNVVENWFYKNKFR